MIVVSDTTPLISLLKIHRIDLLHSLFGEVQIPKGVFDELTVNQKFPDEAAEILSCDFIKIKSVDENQVSLFQRTTGLDLGESGTCYKRYAETTMGKVVLYSLR